MTVYISGVHSGPNPSPGVGTARSLRDAYPDATLVAVDYSNESSGIHHAVFDDVLIFRPWDELHLDAHAEQIRDLLDEGALWISGLDLEVGWLSQQLRGNASALIPSREAFNQTRKPDISAANGLPAEIPSAIEAFGQDTEIERFCQRHDWRVWVKGPTYDSEAASTWKEVVTARKKLSDTWSTRDTIIQSHIDGHEVSISLSAYRGKVLEVVCMKKRVVTESGKTWAGKIESISKDFRSSLEEVITELGWTGGCELEFVQEPNGCLNLIDWNPRFPAWIYGATLAGKNLPAGLLEAATGQIPDKVDEQSREFTRIVEEYPVRHSHPLPEPNLPAPGRTSSEDFSTNTGHKHPSGMPLLSDQHFHESENGRDPLPLRGVVHTDLCGLDLSTLETPARVEMHRSTREAFSAAKDTFEETCPPDISLQLAYSVKTNPSNRLVEVAHNHDLFAEVITGDELRTVRQSGFPPERIIVNGPLGLYDLIESDIRPVAAVFADSLSSLEKLVRTSEMPAKTLGIRIRPPEEDSRFGIPVDDQEFFNNAIDLLRELPDNTKQGLHFHIQSSRVGVQQWYKLARGLITWGEVIEECTGHAINTLNFGGGWTPHDFREHLPEYLPSLVDVANQRLEELSYVILEPGKALARPSTALLSRVVEIRKRPDGGRDVILDAAQSELPLAEERPHPIAIEQGTVWLRLRSGTDRLLGRTCMENDVLANEISIPTDLSHGDAIAFLDSGAYDVSMSYEFGNGKHEPHEYSLQIQV